MKTYDIIVIGSGGGSKITTPASKLGYKVAIIEKDSLGGTCLNRGCIPSKMLIYPADVTHEIRDAHKFNIDVPKEVSTDFASLVSRVTETITKESDSIIPLYEKNPNIDYYRGKATFVSNKVVAVNGDDLTADKIFIAVGSRPLIPNIPGLAGTPYITSTEALRNTVLPKKMLVLGAGYIAVELGHAYASFGCEVHFLVRSTFLRREDRDIRQEFDRVFSIKHHVYRGVTLSSVSYTQNQFHIMIKDKQGKEKILDADAFLIAAGVVPNSGQLGLENTNVTLNDKGFIKVDDQLQTGANGVYALGDCIGNYLFRHSVNFEGEYLMKTLFVEKSDKPISYPPVPHAVFTLPQIAGVGKTEDELEQEGGEYVVGLNAYKDSAMGMARLSDHGFVKILVDKKSRRLLGAHIIGDEASDMIHVLIAFMTANATVDDLLSMIYIHPALPEIVRNAARKAKAALDQT